MNTDFYTQERLERPGLVARALAAGAATLITLGLAALPTMLPAAEIPVQRVQVADLNLDSAEGQRALERRIRLAIDQVCRPATSELQRHPVARRKADECRQHAWNDVQRQLAAHGVTPVPRRVAALAP
jgi:UrcA family protein